MGHAGKDGQAIREVRQGVTCELKTCKKRQTKPSMRGPVSSEAVQILCRGFPHIPFAVGFGRSGPSQTCPRTIQACPPQHIL